MDLAESTGNGSRSKLPSTFIIWHLPMLIYHFILAKITKVKNAK
jgi:hypothetical protein